MYNILIVGTWWGNTFIVSDGGLGGGVYGGRGSAQDSRRIDARARKCDELSSCRSIVVPYIKISCITPFKECRL